MKDSIKSNRERFLHELRNGNRKKGSTKSDERGYPVFETEDDKTGSCACAIMKEMFAPNDNSTSMKKATGALGLNGRDCKFIQSELNDSPLSFLEIADRIEAEVFISPSRRKY